MLIIAGHMLVAEHNRDEFVAAHRDLIGRARQAPGCLDVAITADPLDPRRVNNFERWESRAELEAWRQVAMPPDSDDLMEEVHVMEYTVTAERPPFG